MEYQQEKKTFFEHICREEKDEENFGVWVFFHTTLLFLGALRKYVLLMNVA